MGRKPCTEGPRAEVVPRGWLTDDPFLAGYGAVQALPGLLFTFAAYPGTAVRWLVVAASAAAGQRLLGP
jgi:hypothetical protein